ncbi:MAG TPA: hypothetical protein VHO72_10390 [Bacteroidales bacterium]|nr:hypothetical protein [Bacteroidales bacterium]
MKTNPFIVLLIAAASFTSIHAQVSKQVLLKLQPGETILTSESCVEITAQGNSLYVVTQQGSNVYVYEGSQRKGPFKSFDAARIKNCGSYNNDACAVYEAEDSEIQEFISSADDGKMAIKFNGKSYGPYKFIKELFVSNDKSTFVATVASDDMKFFIVTPEGTIKPASGSVHSVSVSRSHKKFIALEKENEGVDPSLMNADFSNMTTEQLMKMAKEMEEKQKNAGEPKAYVYTNGGKKFGPYPVGSVSDNNPAFCKTGGDNWYMVLDNVLYINGLKVKEFNDISPSACNVWISADGKRWMVSDYDKMVFSDGSKYSAPIKISTENKEGKTILKWVSFENEKELISYSREL